MCTEGNSYFFCAVEKLGKRRGWVGPKYMRDREIFRLYNYCPYTKITINSSMLKDVNKINIDI